MKKNSFLLLIASIFFAAISLQPALAQWQLDGNFGATGLSKLGPRSNFSLRFITADKQRMIIDSFGRVGINTFKPVNLLTVRLNGSDPAFSWLGGGSLPAFMGFGEETSTGFNLATAANGSTFRPVLNTRRSRGSLAAPTAVVNNDFLASFVSSGYDGTAFQNPATIDFYVDGFPSPGKVPGRISFVTGSNVSDRAERLKVGSTGNFNFNKDQLTITQANGNVGIGVPSALAKLHLSVNDGSAYSGVAITNTNTGGKTLTLNQGAAGKLAFTEPGVVDLMTLDFNSRNVGIGTFTPAYKLDVAGRMRLQSGGGSAGAWFMNAANTTESAFAGMVNDNYVGLYGNAGAAWGLAMNIASGNIGIGTILPDNRLVVTNNTTNRPTVVIQNLFGAPEFNDGLYIQAGNNAGTGGSWFAAFQKPNGDITGSVEQVDANSVRYNTTSDKRLKTNIHDTKFGLADVQKIQVRDYNFINSNSSQTGFIAQELYEIYPEAVAVGGEDPKKRPWMVDYGRVTPLLVKAIQDLAAENKEKQTTIATLQMQVNSFADELKNLRSLVVNSNKITPVFAGGYLKQNAPNPATNSTVIGYYLPQNAARGEIRITDLKGSVLKIYTAARGEGQLKIENGVLSAGLYTYSLYVNNKVIDSKQMVVAR